MIFLSGFYKHLLCLGVCLASPVTYNFKVCVQPHSNVFGASDCFRVKEKAQRTKKKNFFWAASTTHIKKASYLRFLDLFFFLKLF
jgi:hypothetical protein